jgi:hypothetical protein
MMPVARNRRRATSYWIGGRIDNRSNSVITPAADWGRSVKFLAACRLTSPRHYDITICNYMYFLILPLLAWFLLDISDEPVAGRRWETGIRSSLNSTDAG